jgi:hypothetical protein
MKLTLSLGLIVAAASTLAACSSDEGTPRTPTGAGGSGAAGSPTGTAGTGGTGGSTGGSSAGGTGGTGTTGNFTYGAAFTISAEGNVVDEAGTTGVSGGTYLSQSTNMTVDATTAHRAGALCFKGTTAVVPTSSDYGTYWGAELGLNLKLIPDPDAPPPVVAADAGADAGAGAALIPDPNGIPYGNAIGFSYKVVGNNPAAADKGVPATRVRFKALPKGSVGANDSYCSNRDGLADQKVENVLFDDITFECWNMGNPSIGPDEPTINRVNPGPPVVVETPANPKALTQISWQVASDVAATTPAPIAFDFCITELKPITGQ